MSGHVILDGCHNCGAAGIPLFIVDVSESSMSCAETKDQGPHIHVFAACEKCRAEIWDPAVLPAIARKRGSMSTLVRVTEAPHEGLLVCPEHQREVAADRAFEALPEAEAKFWGQRCLMCGVDPVPGRACENERCRRPLAPRWPAVYCCNACALEDM